MTRSDLITLYCELTRRNSADVPWFFTLACYKLACILEGSYARSLAGQASAETGLRLHGVANWLFTKAERLIGES
jgi:aminoglycoside phosphotransferase (APT) family kinase protein